MYCNSKYYENFKNIDSHNSKILMLKVLGNCETTCNFKTGPSQKVTKMTYRRILCFLQKNVLQNQQIVQPCQVYNIESE